MSGSEGILPSHEGGTPSIPGSSRKIGATVKMTAAQGVQDGGTTMAREVRIGCVQSRPLATFDEAIEEACRLAGNAVEAGAELVCLPEYCGGLKSEGGLFAPPTAPEAQHPVLDALRGFAGDSRVWMLIGSIAVDGPGDRLVNRGYVIDDKGDIQARYDKIFLFDVDLSPTQQYRESAVVAPGEHAVVADTPWGRLGMTICYDLRFPQLYRALAQAGAEILVAPAAFTKVTGEAHWHVLNRARAIENGAVVVAPCAVGAVPGGGAAYGHSLVVSPWGEVLADGGDGVGHFVTTVDVDSVAIARGRIPSLRHDRRFSRPDEYGRRHSAAA